MSCPMRKALLCAAVAMFLCPSAFAEENFADLLKKAADLKEQGKYREALDNLGWASKQLETLHAGKMSSFLPAKVGDFTGGEPETSSALGLVAVERTYWKPDGAKVKLTLAGASGGELGAGVGGLAAFAQLGAMMSGAPGVEQVRIKGRQATITNEDNQLKLLLPIGSSVMTLDQESGSVSKEQLQAIGEAVDIQGLAAYSGAK